jgi:hypothetical protein
LTQLLQFRWSDFWVGDCGDASLGHTEQALRNR